MRALREQLILCHRLVYIILNLPSFLSDICSYVTNLSDACEGGGYIAWTRLVLCQDTMEERGLLIAASVLLMLYLFVALGTAADEFFSRTIAAIAEQLGISQNIAV